MKIALPREPHRRAAWASVAVAALVAATAPWLSHRRAEARMSPNLTVTSGADDGRGSLRQAVLAADRADGFARIDIRVPRIVLESPLPPLVNAHGVLITGGATVAELDASRTGGAALDVASPNSSVQRLRIITARTGVVVRATNVRLTELQIDDADVGVLAGAGADGLAIERSAFRRNRIGVQNADGGRAQVSATRFEDHALAAIWAVSTRTPSEMAVLDSRFLNDAGGVVLVNRSARVELNEFNGMRETAVLVTTGRAIVRANRIRSGRGFGVLLDRVASATVYRNEIANNCAGGVMVRHAQAADVLSNELYTNGFGIIVLDSARGGPYLVADNLVMNHQQDGVMLIGSSPLVRGNRLLQNSQAGLRLSVLVRDGERLPTSPRLDGNVLRGNGRDEPLRDSYDASVTSPASAPPTDCPWRGAPFDRQRPGPGR